MLLPFGDSKPIFNACQKKLYLDHLSVAVPFGSDRLVITEKFTRERVLGFKRAIELERGGMSYLIR